jgi:hypothetical protein
MTTDSDDPSNNMLCDWPGCSTRGNPYEDDGWCFYFRYHLWLPEGFYCPAHTAFIEAGKQNGFFDDWPRDMSPDVLETLEALDQFVPLESEEGQRIVRGLDAEVRRAEFRVHTRRKS